MRVLCILLVEDDDIDAMLIREMVSAAGHGTCRIERAAYLEDAKRLLAEGSAYDLVMVDLHLPDAMGPACVAALKGEAPIVAMSGRDGDEALKQACIDAGAVGFISKVRMGPDRAAHALTFARKG